MDIKDYLSHVTLRRILVLLGSGAALYVAWLVYGLGKVNGVVELAELRNEYAGLEQRYNEASGENEALRKQAAVLERSAQIDRQAIQDVKSEFGEHQEELLALREEIEFYRGIVSPGEVKPGLRVYRFEVVAGNEPGEYRFDLVLTQFKRNDRYVKGTVRWEIAGRQGEEPQVLALADITGDKHSVLNFRFRYFQHLTGNIRLPETFEVDTVLLRVKPAAKGSPVVEHTLKWPSVKKLRQGES
jgi:hypothetical protein